MLHNIDRGRAKDKERLETRVREKNRKMPLGGILCSVLVLSGFNLAEGRVLCDDKEKLERRVREKNRKMPRGGILCSVLVLSGFNLAGGRVLCDDFEITM